jgi:1,5-anhydro-D-fructose reductase (1,5-anhydro-D-mannitol-forming)
VIGLGRFARGRLLPALSRAPHAALVGAYTRDAGVREAVGTEYGVTAYDTYDAAVADPHVQIVGLATPHALHADQAIEAAGAGKHVFVEKPMALTVVQARRMIAAAKSAGVGLFVGFHLRFHEAHRRARDLIRSGALGDVVWAAAKWAAYRPPDTGWRLDPASSGGTILTARGVHLLDLIRFVTGAEFETVTGESDGFRSSHPVDDVVAAFGRLSSGAIAHMLCSRLVPASDDTLEVYGTRGRLVCRGVFANDAPSSLSVNAGAGETVQTFPPSDMLIDELDHVSEAVATGAPPSKVVAATGVDGARVTCVTEALVESVRHRRTVQVQREGEEPQ